MTKDIKSKYVPKALQDKVDLWIYRIIFELNTQYIFLDNKGSFFNNEVASYLKLKKYISFDDFYIGPSEDHPKREEIFEKLYKNYQNLSQKQNISSSRILEKNLNELSKIMNLNKYEKTILEFFIIAYNVEILLSSLNLLEDSLNSSQAKKALSKILNIPIKEVNNAFGSNSKLVASSLIILNKNGIDSFNRKFDVLDDFFDDIFNKDEPIINMLKSKIKPLNKAKLTLKDYSHIQKDINILIPYLEKAIETKQKGVNILFYGLPGTGKTELVKTISKVLNTNSFEVSYTDEDGDTISRERRLKAYKVSQSLLSNQKTFLMYDEAEDIFESNRGFFALFAPNKQKDKAWINRMLESNPIPTIWITNDIESMDSAVIRRFDLSIEFPIPPKQKRIEIIKKYTKNLISETTIQNIANNEKIAPALVSSAIRVTKTISNENKDEVFKRVLDNTLKAQGYTTSVNNTSLPNNYNPQFINTSLDLEELTQGIKETQNARICLYGPAGTGKSAFGKYIAEVLNKPYILKKGSDLLGMYVGENEKNIAKAFEEAKNEDAVLIFDEVDTFLQDRNNANRSWEISQVNEMLVQMENFNGIFIATTNLMDNLDKASLRRFDLKLEFSYLNKTQRIEMFKSFCKELNLDYQDYKKIEKLEYLTPGDFAAVIRQNRFRPIKSSKDFMDRLVDEVKIKEEAKITKSVGFM